MKLTLNEKFISWLTLFSGLAITGVAEYYSIMGLIAIYPAALTPIVIMGIVLGIGKISGTLWLKQNWDWSPLFLKAYVLPAVIVLMLITSLGVFGFLSKAHSDQSLVSGDVLAKIAVYDENIRTERDNIDANRKSLKQMDEAVDQVMARSTTEGGADRAATIRRSQQKERARILADITASQKRIATLNESRAPIAAEVRKVEAEVGPIKYIARLLYSDVPDANILEKAVIWITVLIVIVLDPLAVILLLASQYSFQRISDEEKETAVVENQDEPVTDQVKISDEYFRTPDAVEQKAAQDALLDEYFTCVFPNPGEGKGTLVETLPEDPAPFLGKGTMPSVPMTAMYTQPVVDDSKQDTVAEKSGYQIIPDLINEDKPVFKPPTPIIRVERPLRTKIFKKPVPKTDEPDERPGDYVTPAVAETAVDVQPKSIDGEYVHINGQTYHKNSLPQGVLDSYVQNEEQKESNLWSTTKKD
jgi:hypothetical protein